MTEYSEFEHAIEVPKGTGIQGFLKVVGEILKIPRLQNINIDSRGHVTYRFYAPADEGAVPTPLEIDLSSLTPGGVIRNNDLVEVLVDTASPAVLFAEMFHAVYRDRLFPIAFAGGATSQLWAWLASCKDERLADRVSAENLFGLPFLADRYIEDEVLILCAGYTRGSALVDTQKSYKVVIPQVKA